MPLLRALRENAALPDLRELSGGLLDLLQPYADRLMRGPSPLSPAERELIAAFVSGVNSCGYCFGSHSLVARGFGVDERVFDSLMSDIEAAPIDARLKPILRYVRKLTEAPARMTRADADEVYKAGWDDEALLHAVAVCAYFNNMNRLVEGCGLARTPEGAANAARRLIARGYVSERRGGGES